MKKFDIELAKQGKPVCTRNGDPVRILCFDREYMYGFCIVALVKGKNVEFIREYDKQGCGATGFDADNDLMMAGEKHSGYINIYKWEDKFEPGGCIYPSEKEAKAAVDEGDDGYIATIKIEWEE